jgi:enoyl-CoA hydratase/carnithine racemase
MSSEPVQLKINNGIAQVTLNRPDKHNALDMAMFVAVRDTIKQIQKNQKVRVVIVSGAGESFCSGIDVKWLMHDKAGAIKLLWKWWPRQANLAQFVTVGWRRLSIPVIMVLHGKCWGGGMQIALGGDFRIVSPETTLAIMEAKWGLIPDMGGTPALKENLALDQALRLAMTAEPIDAQQALELNLITQVADEPMAEALKLAEQLVNRSPDTNQTIKKLYHKIWSSRDGKILAQETINQWRVLLGKNRKIAVKKALGDTESDYH